MRRLALIIAIVASTAQLIGWNAGQFIIPRATASSLAALSLSDITAVGAFEPPNPDGGDDIDFGTGLALRRVSGVPYLYMTGYLGRTVEFSIPADGSLTLGTPSTTATVTGQYGDIFQNAAYQSVVSDGGTNGPRQGLAGGWRPNGLFWDETSSRMYWTAFARYDNDPTSASISSSSVANPTVITTSASHGLLSNQTVKISGHTGSTPAISGLYQVTVINGTTFTIPVNVSVGGTGGTVVTTSDNALGYSTMNAVAKTGTGVATWKLSPRGSTSTDAMSDVGNRWTNGVTRIPSDFATTYLSGKTLGIGCGDPSISIASNGPISMGPAFFALDPSTLSVAQDRDYFNGTLQKILFHPFKSAVSAPLYKTRPSGLTVNVHQSNAYDAENAYVTLADKMNGCVWIRGSSKEGFVVPSLGPTGSMSTTISASPTPTNTVFTVGNVGDTAIGDRVFFQTVESQPQTPYDISYAVVTNVSGQQLTVTSVRNGNTGDPDSTIAYAGGVAFSGTRYVGGGNISTRLESFWYVYSAASLALSIQGSTLPSAVTPVSEGTKNMPGLTWPLRATDSTRIVGVAYDDVAKRLYVALRDVPIVGMIIAVFSVNC